MLTAVSKTTERINFMSTRRTGKQARDFILEVAETNLIERGLEGLKISELAKSTGMRHSNILHHFGSIDRVHEALILKISDRLIAELVEIIATADLTTNMSHEATREIVGRIIRQVFELFSERAFVSLVCWDVLSSRSREITELEQPIEDFAAYLTFRLTEVGVGKNAERGNILAIIEMVLAAALGDAIARAFLPASFKEEPTSDKIEEWVCELITRKSGLSEN